MRVIAVSNRKGGVGKSTTTVNLAAALGRLGHRVLVIDMDSQGSATKTLLESISDDAPSTAHVLIGHSTLEEVTVPSTSPNVDLAPSTKQLTGAQFNISGKTGRETILRRALRSVSGYEVILIDTAPEQQLATANALVASTHVLMPFTPDPLALEGLQTTAEAVQEIRDAELGECSVLGCVQLAFDRRMGITQDAREQVRAAYGNLLLETTIRQNTQFYVCPAWHRDIFQLETKERPPRKGSEDFMALANEVVVRLALPTASNSVAA